MTVTEAFQSFKSALELPAKHSEQASSAQQELRRILGKHIAIEDSFLTGSYSRHTKIHPLNDIDVILVRNSARVGLAASGGIPAFQALDDLAHAVSAAFASVTVKLQSRSVNATFQGLAFGFDLIPAWFRQPDGYWIPDRESGAWVATNPTYYERLLTEANERTEGRLKPIIKMVKHWSRNNHDLLRSFHIELICERISRYVSFQTFQLGVTAILTNLVHFAGVQMNEPAYGLCRADKPLSPEQLSTLKNRINYDAGNARQAVELERLGNHSAAIEVWKHIFLSGFSK